MDEERSTMTRKAFWGMVLVWGALAGLTAGCGGGGSSSASTSSTVDAEDSLMLAASVSQTTVTDGTSFLTPQVTLTVQHARGDVEFLVRSEPALDWFEVRDGTLSFAGLQRADYDAAVLAGVEDVGQGKPIALSITAVDAGREAGQQVTVEVEVRVVLLPFAITVSSPTVRTRHDLSVLLDFVLFLPQNAQGAVEYTLARTSPAVDWFVVDAEGLLHFAEGEVANYDALEDVVDRGEGKPIVLTVAATDAGRPGTRHAEVELVVHVLPPPFELSVSPSVVTVDSGSNRLNASNRIEVTLDNPQYLLGEASYSVSTALEGGWFAIRSDDVDPQNGVLSLVRVLDYTALDGVPLTEAGRVLRVLVKMEDGGRAMSASAEQLVDVVVTLRPKLSPLWLDPNVLVSRVTHGEAIVTPDVRFRPNALGTMSYQLTTEPSLAADWLVLREEGENGAVVLDFAEDQVASYDALSVLEDSGVRPVLVTVTGTDAGRLAGEGNVSKSSVTLEVHQLAVRLSINPATTNIAGGETTLTPTPAIGGSHTFGRTRYAIHEMRPAIDWFAIDAATGVISLTRPANYLDAALDPPQSEGGSKRIEVDIELTALDRSSGQRVVGTLVVNVNPPTSLTVVADRDRTRVEDGSTTLAMPIQFIAQGPNAESAQYALGPVDPSEANWFQVDSANGQLTLKSEADYGSLKDTIALNGVKEVLVSVLASAEGADTASASVTIEVARSADAFHLLTSAMETSVSHGESSLEPAIALSTEHGSGTVSYQVVRTSPSVSWFEVGTDDTLAFASGLSADYGEDTGDALQSESDFGSGKPVLVTLSATDTSSEGGVTVQTTVEVFVLPPPLKASISPPTATIQHGTRALDTEFEVTVEENIGLLDYEVRTEPEVDWFRVKPGSGAVYVRADRAIDWSALEVETSADGSKELSLLVVVTDQGRSQKNEVQTERVTLSVEPTPFIIYASRASASMEHGASDQSTTIHFYSEANTGDVTYSVAGTSPTVNWFTVDGDGDLLVAASQTLDYLDPALDDVLDEGLGKIVYVSVMGEDGGVTAVTSVIVYVQLPPFALQVSDVEVNLREAAIALEGDVIFNPIRNVGPVNYQLSTNPAVDWFEVVDDKLALAYGANVRRDSLPTDQIQIYVAAMDSGRHELDPGGIALITITVRLLQDSGVRLALSNAHAEFFEKGGQLEPNINYELQDIPSGLAPLIELEGDTKLCGGGDCDPLGIAFDDEGACGQQPNFCENTTGSLKVRFASANFWETKAHYQGRGDQETLPLYLRLISNLDADGEPYAGPTRNVLITMKDKPGDEEITLLEGGELFMPAGDGDDLFFFPISQRLNIETSVPLELEFETDNDLFTVRNVGFVYREDGGFIDSGAYGVHPAPHVGYLGACAFKPCVRGVTAPWRCSNDGRQPDYRLALEPTKTLTYAADAPAHEVSLTVSFLGEAAGPTTTVVYRVKVIQRQDGTGHYPFQVDSAEELRSIGLDAFRSDYTENYCDVLPTCVDGALARFHTRVSRYLQTDTIDLASNFERSLGQAGVEGAIRFHGRYNGNGHSILGLETSEAGLFGYLGTTAVVHDLHLRGVNIVSNRTRVGGLVSYLDGYFPKLYFQEYMAHRRSQLTLPYYDIYFGSLWNRFDHRESDVDLPLVLRSGVSGTVHGIGHVGGLVGEVRVGEVFGSYSTGEVIESGSGASFRSAGGLVGTFSGGFSEFNFSTSNVRGTYDVGGLVGHDQGGYNRKTSFAAGTPSTYAGTSLTLGSLIGRSRSQVFYSYAVAPGPLFGREEGGSYSNRIYRLDAPRWTCSDGPFFWYSRAVGFPYATCAEFTGAGLDEADYGWDYGTAEQYPVPNYNALTAAEIRCVAFSETSFADCVPLDSE